MHMPDPQFPPLLTGHGIKGAEPAFETACAGAAAGRFGAGDVVWSRNVWCLDLALVLEPEVPLAGAVQMVPLAMVAAADSIGSLLPPQVGLTFSWPVTLRLNGAVAGAVRAGVPPGVSSQDVPPWLVVGLWLRHLRRSEDPEPGEAPDITWLSEEGGQELTRTELIESYCRHFLTWLHLWQTGGFRPVHEAWLFRAEGRRSTIAVETPDGTRVEGDFLGLDEGGNLLVKDQGGLVRSLHLVDWVERL